MIRPALARHISEPNVKVLGDFFLNGLDGDLKTPLFLEHVAKKFLGLFNRHLLAGQGLIGGDSHQRAFQTPHVAANARGKEVVNILRQLHIHELLFFAEDRHAGFDIRRLHVCDKPPFEPRNQSLLQPLDFAGGPVAREHDLLVSLVQAVEGVEELLLDAFLAGEELDVIDEEDIGLALAPAKTHQLAVLDRVDEFVGELLDRNVGDPRPFFVRDHMLANGV
jgi:hypothetical protein